MQAQKTQMFLIINETSYNCSYFYKKSLKHANYLNYYDNI